MIVRYISKKRQVFLLFAIFLLTDLIPQADGLMAQEEKASIFKWGFQERVRQESLLNCFDLESDYDDDRNHIRFRTQLWFSVKPKKDIELYVKLNNEHRYYMKPDKNLDIAEYMHELIFESLYLELSDIAGSPVTVTVGRQNIMLGEGFIYFDGNPLDGSRTAYMNAAKVSMKYENRSLMLVPNTVKSRNHG